MPRLPQGYPHPKKWEVTEYLKIGKSGDEIRIRRDSNNKLEIYNATDNSTLFTIDQDTGDVFAKGDITIADDVMSAISFLISNTGDDIKLRKDGSGNLEIYNNTDGSSLFTIDEDTAKAVFQGNIDLNSNSLLNATIDGGDSS